MGMLNDNEVHKKRQINNKLKIVFKNQNFHQNFLIPMSIPKNQGCAVVRIFSNSNSDSRTSAK